MQHFGSLHNWQNFRGHRFFIRIIFIRITSLEFGKSVSNFWKKDKDDILWVDDQLEMKKNNETKIKLITLSLVGSVSNSKNLIKTGSEGNYVTFFRSNTFISNASLQKHNIGKYCEVGFVDYTFLQEPTLQKNKYRLKIAQILRTS